MKINVEFNSMAEMVNFGKFVGNELVQPPQPQKKDRDMPVMASSWKEAYERTLANLERAYERIREFELMKEHSSVIKEEVEKITKKMKDNKERDHILNLEIDVRPYNCLLAENISYISDLVKRTPEELLKIPNFGKLSLQNVRNALREKGLKLTGDA